jgi:hypothetical protein
LWLANLYSTSLEKCASSGKTLCTALFPTQDIAWIYWAATLKCDRVHRIVDIYVRPLGIEDDAFSAGRSNLINLELQSACMEFACSNYIILQQILLWRRAYFGPAHTRMSYDEP